LNNDDIKKCCLVQNAQDIGMVDTVFEALLNDKSFSEICNFLRSHAIRHDQQAKEKNSRQNHNTCQPMDTTKKGKVKTVSELINELQLQDSTGSDEEVDISAVNTSNIYESQQETDYDYWTSEHSIHTSISMNNTLYNKCMNLLFLPEKYHISILDDGADTCILGKRWEI
jgi:hypothetical protein